MSKLSPELFDLARRAKTARPQGGMSLEFLSHVFEERGYVLTDCEVLSVTYLAWHESALKSGVTWADHLRVFKYAEECKLDAGIRDLFQKALNRLEEVQAESTARADHRLWMSLAGFGAGCTAIGTGFWWLTRRRMEIARQEAAARAERRAQRRMERHQRRAERQAKASAPADSTGAGDATTQPPMAAPVRSSV